MPIIELKNGPLDRLWVRALMLFPTDQVRRLQCFAVDQTRANILDEPDGKSFQIDARTLRLLLEAPSYSKHLKQDVAERTKRAFVAGDILTALYLMNRFSVSEPSMNKAVAVVRAFAKTTTYGDGSRIDTSEAMVRQHWREFQSVAHIWAALRINQSYPYARDREQFSGKGYEAFLQVAQGLHHFGISFIPKRAKRQVPILDPETSWTLPKSIPAKNLNSTRSPDRLLRFLQNYKA